MTQNITASAMKSGLTLGVLFSLNFLLSLTGIPFIRLIIFIGIIYMTYRLTIQYRDKECGGHLSYGQSFTYIIFSFFFAALISAFVKLVYFQFISPDSLTNLYHETMQILETNNFPMIDEMANNLEAVLKPAPYALYSLFGNMMGAVFAGLIISGFTKKEKGIFDEPNDKLFNNN